MKLHLFTASYPFGFGESYLNNELPLLVEKFDEVHIYPFNATGIKQSAFFESNRVFVHIHQSDASRVKPGEFILLIRILIFEWTKMKPRLFFLKNLRKFYAQLKQSLFLRRWLKLHNPHPGDAYYSFWMNEWALALAMEKYAAGTPRFLFRVNGYDIYNERHEANYLPFRNFIYKQTARVVAVSKTARDYLKKLGVYPDKISHSYFGTSDTGICGANETSEYVIFSNSSALPIKRLDKVARIICRLDFPVTWVHHGDGPTLNAVLEQMQTAPVHIKFVHSPKKADYGEVLEQMRRLNPHLFINLSSSEGLPVSAIEALSQGIPVLMNDVGSCSELINSTTGILVAPDCPENEVAGQITALRERGLSVQIRADIRQFWQTRFSAKKNYAEFAEFIRNIYAEIP